MTRKKWLTVLWGFLLVCSAARGAVAVEQKEGGTPDQTDNNYYWQGTQLYNLGRLGEAFESFEKAIQKKQNSKEAEAYLLQIRQEIVTNAKQRADQKQVLRYDPNSPESALNVSTIQKGYTKIILQAKYLFNENTALLKTGSVEVLNRLADLMEIREGSRVELSVVDDLDALSNVRDVDAERSLVIFSYLNFRKLSSSATGG